MDERWKRSNIRVEGDADKLVRLPLAALDDPSAYAPLHQGMGAGRLKVAEDQVEIQVIHEVR